MVMSEKEAWKRLLGGLEPDAAEAHRIEMILKAQRASLDRIAHGEVILHEHVVVIYRDRGRHGDLAIHDNRALDVDVITLPQARTPAGIDERRTLFVKSTRFAIEVGLVNVGVQHLQLGEAFDENTTAPRH